MTVTATRTTFGPLLAQLDRNRINHDLETRRQGDDVIVVRDDLEGRVWVVEDDAPDGYRLTAWTPREWDDLYGQPETDESGLSVNDVIDRITG